MKTNDPILDEIYEIRRKTYEITKNMTTKERVAYINQRGEAIAKKYGFEHLIVKNATDKTDSVSDEIYERRRKINEETKGMTIAEQIEYFCQRSKAVVKESDAQYDFEHPLVKSADDDE